jgi:hypothetical protein
VAMQTWHAEMRALLLDLSLAADASWQQALADFANGVPLNGLLPEGLVNGDGGAVDDLRAAVDKHLAKLATSLNKRLDKAEKAADKEGFGFLGWTGTPSGMLPSAADEALTVSSFPPFSIDILMSLSALDVASDGRMWVGGASNSGKLNVNVSVTQGLDTLDDGTVAVNVSLAWLLPLDGEGAGMPEGNVIVFADLDGIGAIESKAFGIR